MCQALGWYTAVDLERRACNRFQADGDYTFLGKLGILRGRWLCICGGMHTLLLFISLRKASQVEMLASLSIL